MIAVSVSRVQAMGNELAEAEDRAERQLNEKVAIIAEDLIGELLQSRLKLAEIEPEVVEVEHVPTVVEFLAHSDDESHHCARLQRSLSVSGPISSSELRKIEAARPLILRRRLRKVVSKPAINTNRRTMPDCGILRPIGDTKRKTGLSFCLDPELSTHNFTARQFSHESRRESFESLHKNRSRITSVADRHESLSEASIKIEDTRLSCSEDPRTVTIVDEKAEGRLSEKTADSTEPQKKHPLFKHVKAAAWTSIGMVAYCLLGGLFISLIEEPHELVGRAYKEEQHKNFVDNILLELGVNASENVNETLKIVNLVENFENNMISALKSTIPDGEPTWTFVRSWFFSWTVVTAIGYGNYTPVTQLGRVWVMVFGMLGIPLVVLNSMRFGALFTQLAIVGRNKILLRLRKLNKKRVIDLNCADTVDKDDTIKNYMPPWVAVTLLPTYCAIMAAVFCSWEHWNYFDSFYFTFVTLAGIGLGDIAPSREEVMILFTVFMMIGLGLFAMFMEMGANQFVLLGKRINRIFKLQVESSLRKASSSMHSTSTRSSDADSPQRASA